MTITFTEKLNARIEKHSMLSHPFYQAWNEGKLDKDILGKYAQQYFAQVKAFPTYVSGVHSQMDELEVRQMLLENLIEEEQGPENHPELWLRFAEGLGVKREDVQAATLLPQTQESVDRLKDLTRNQGPIAGLVALYAYESQIPAVAKTKRAGLKDFYELDDERAVAFFRVHETADVLHSATEREVLERLCDTEDKEELALDKAEEAAKALWHFLDGVTEAYLPELSNCA